MAAGNGENGAEAELAPEAPVNGTAKDSPEKEAAPAAELDAAAIAVIEDDKPKGFGWLKKWLGL